MSKKRDYISPYLLIIKKLRHSRVATFAEINNYIEHEFELLDKPVSVSLRTFQRDLNEIRSIFNVDIQCNTSNQYYINEDEYTEFNHRMLESFDMINAFNASRQMTAYIELENRSTLGTEHLYGIIHAIKNRLVLVITYQAFTQTEETVREVEPYLLKEFNVRWYILLKDRTDNNIKTFGIDRIHNNEITKKKYSKQQDFNPKDYYKDCFGIFKSNELKPTKIILSFESLQGKYIRTYPLHSSQEILIDNDKELKIRLFVYESPDLITELLSFGDKVKVLQPQSLIDTMIDKIKDMTKKYDI